ncbi:protein of unknown function [Cyanobium sp. NIES-981]|nr:protein of unknown function [Cyanobium sp. NIES-981]
MNIEARLLHLDPQQTGRRAGRICGHCGGSGILRLDDQRFRTCLDCLGQGRCAAPAITPISGSVSSSAA